MSCHVVRLLFLPMAVVLFSSQTGTCTCTNRRCDSYRQQASRDCRNRSWPSLHITERPSRYLSLSLSLLHSPLRFHFHFHHPTSHRTPPPPPPPAAVSDSRTLIALRTRPSVRHELEGFHQGRRTGGYNVAAWTPTMHHKPRKKHRLTCRVGAATGQAAIQHWRNHQGPHIHRRRAPFRRSRERDEEAAR